MLVRRGFITRSSSGAGVPFRGEGDGLDRRRVKKDRVSGRVRRFRRFRSWKEVVREKDSFKWS